ncbi:hypothetical protein LAZ67_19001939 [Cordylochernes scorpioides]|uniref:DUF5641 domain-containing protein n=1 Tax=Cordylochernes scorpioides TaxID=51811 RepID=A0ABY6LKB5_9ARAC|nr:hypothetical protein LAZ67_19001939 [Cordylochernes scorpioides]
MEQSISSPSWILGRVSKTFHGLDMLVRTVELRTGKGLLRRPVNKLAVLPLQKNVETQSKGYLKVQLDNINKIKENIENYMIEFVDSDEHESHMLIYKEANKDITEIQSALLNYLELKENINTKIEETKINLPKFSLPSFKGYLDQWLDFKTTFEDTIINDSSLNNIQKFKYLQSSLSGDAASIIMGFSLTPDTFDKARARLACSQ